MFGRKAKNIDLMRIPDKPTIEDLNAIGKGYDGHDYDESKFGLLVLDECGTWFNSRNWQDKTRKDVNDWFLHARKLCWDVYIIIQDFSMLDSQARDAIGELIVTCRRLDKLRVPFIGGLIKTFTGFNPTMPRIHRAKVTYADGLVSDVWVYRGNDLFACYDTRQSFIQNYPHGTHSVLPPWHTHGRYAVTMNWSNIMRITKIYWKRFASPVSLATGLLLGAFAMLINQQPVIASAQTLSDQNLFIPQQTPTDQDIPAQDKNPFSGLQIYLVGEFANDLMFQVHWPDNTFMSIKESELVALGFEVARVGHAMAKVTFDKEVNYALPKRTTQAVVDRTQAVHDQPVN